MNQITSNTDYKGTLDDLAPLKPRPERQATKSNGSEADQADKPAARAPDAQNPDRHAPGLTAADLQMVRKTLLSGEAALAKRSDVVELYNRVVKLFETLNKGVGEMYVAKAETDRKDLSQRIDGLEDAVNRMEGALRIEFEPVLRQTMAQVIADQDKARPRSRGRGLGMVLMLGAGLTLGAIFHAPVSAAATSIVSILETHVSKVFENQAN